MCVCTPCAGSDSGGQKTLLNPQELVVSCCVGAGNQTWVLLTSEPSLQTLRVLWPHTHGFKEVFQHSSEHPCLPASVLCSLWLLFTTLSYVRYWGLAHTGQALYHPINLQSPLCAFEIKRKHRTWVAACHVPDQTGGLLHAVEILSKVFPTTTKMTYTKVII